MAKTTKDDNMALWKRVEKTNPKYVKEIKKSWGKMSTPNAQYQRMSATEEFGVYGKTWGIKSIKYKFLEQLPPNNETLALATAIFFIPDGEFQVSSSIKIVAWFSKAKYHALDDEFAKKIETDIVTKALSFLGFNADIFLGNWDDNKYVAALKLEFKDVNSTPPPPPRMKKMTDTVYTQGMAAIESGDADKISNLSTYLKGVEDCDKKKEMTDLISKVQF